VKSLVRTDPELLVLKSGVRKDPTDWSPDGRWVLYNNYEGSEANKEADMWVLPMFGDRRPRRYEQSPFRRWSGRFSPDGHWVAFAANDTGKPEVYVQPFPANNVRWLVSTKGGEEPQWRDDGKELFYLAADGWLCAVSVAYRNGGLDFAEPRPLFKVSTKDSKLRNVYAASGDGMRFLVDTPLENAATVPLTVVINWTAGIQK
jgi:dipeptidyl aminopeptidase/acylaminoacyl peptidase